VARSSDMGDAKPRNARRWALGTAGVVLAWLLGVWPPPLWWRDHWPRATAMMQETADCRSPSACPTVRPTALRDITPVLQRMVIIGEDSRFRTHHGIDLSEIADALGADREGRRGFPRALVAAWRQRDRVRGASTITQQLAKNLYLSASRNPLRKLKEAVTALRLEAALSKDRILELYLGIAEWGPGVWGAEAASRTYFGVAPAQLTDVQAAALAATLPHPRSSNPIFRPERMLARRDLILARYRGVAVAIPAEEEADSLPLGALPEPAPPFAPDGRDVPPPVAAESSGVSHAPGDTLPPQTERGGRDSLP
jgi:monofunctional glycosyltransferase